MNAFEQAVNDGSPFVAVTGPARTGKTEVLVRRVERMLREGATPRDVRVLVPSESHAREFSSRLAASDEPASRAVDVMTIPSLCWGVLVDPACQRETGLVPDVLDVVEEDSLIDQVSRLSGDYVRNVEIVKFLLREWTELGDTKPGYFISSEEKNLHDELKKDLRARGRMLRHELANCTVRYLEGHPETLGALQTRFVVADGFEAMCKASQVLCALLCTGGMTVAGDANQSFEVADPYPYAKGIEELAEEKRSSVHRLDVSSATDSLVGFEQAFCKSIDGMEAAQTGSRRDGAVEIVDVKTPDEEARYVAWRLAALSEAEKAQTLVIVPSEEWGRRLERLMADQEDDTKGGALRAVAVLTPEHAAGLSRKTVFMAGVLDGFYPSFRALDPEESVNHRRYYRMYDERRFYSAATRATERLVVTCPLSADYEMAMEAGLKIGRIRASENGKIALLRPSEFLGR